MQSLWGLGLRPAHFSDYQSLSTVPPLEIMADNILHHRGGPALQHTLRLATKSPCVVLHGIGLNIGGMEPLSKHYLEGLLELVRLFNPQVVSDHLCFTGAAGLRSYELLPVVRNQHMLEHVVRRVDEVQQTLGRQLSLENVSAYVAYKEDSIPEGEFLNRIADRTGCGILLDVNNVYVSAINFSLDPQAELARFELGFVKQIHVAGHSLREDFLFDTHDGKVCREVWKMCRAVAAKRTDIPVILENDDPSATLDELLRELEFGMCGVLDD
ncbi:MAG: hypothetical protein RLZZ488_573 [Pseudomonadota bacterium]